METESEGLGKFIMRVPWRAVGFSSGRTEQVPFVFVRMHMNTDQLSNLTRFRNGETRWQDR